MYETHGRIAIEVSDWAEFRQCHSVLQQLYADGMPVGGWMGRVGRQYWPSVLAACCLLPAALCTLSLRA